MRMPVTPFFLVAALTQEKSGHGVRMRILHTADWHLGKWLHGQSLLEDQAFILEQILELARDQRPDAVVLAGDVYDRSVPPAPAVELFSITLDRFQRDLGVPFFFIAGNHDSPERLAFAAGILARSRIFVAGQFVSGPAPVRLEDAHGPVDFHLIPYLHPVHVRTALGDETLNSHDTATAAAMATIRPHLDPQVRHVALAHAFVAGSRECESERPLTVGGSGAVPAQVFEGFHYTALGHLHGAQHAGGERLRYSGSPLKYSFSEAGHRKSVSLVELNGRGEVAVTEFPLIPRRNLRVIEGMLDELLGRKPPAAEREDYLLIRLLDGSALLDPLGRLREVYPNVLQIERPAFERSGEETGLSREDLKQDELSLFRSFFTQVTGEALTEEQAEAFRTVAGAAIEAGDS